MTLTKKQKKLLAVLIPAAVVVLAGVIAAVILLTAKPEPEKPFLLQRDEETGQITRCELQQGISQEDTYRNIPLPYYTFTMPEGWTHTLNGAESANQYSTEYRDSYLDETGAEIQILQTVAKRPYTALPDQEIRFGELQVLYFQATPAETEIRGGGHTSVCWVYGDSLIQLDYYRQRDPDQMVELVSRMDYDTLVQPIYTPLVLYTPENPDPNLEEGAVQGYWTGGHPQLPEPVELFYLPQAPEGFTQISGGLHPDYVNGLSFSDGIYENEAGKDLYFYCTVGPNDFFVSPYPFTQDITQAELKDPGAVTAVTVNGNPGYVHINEEVSQIGWMDGYCTLYIHSAVPMTQQELVALAESAVPAVAEEAGSAGQEESTP